MSRSRYGSFRRGKDKIKNKFDKIKTKSAPIEFVSDDILDFQYVYTQGIWGITATNQFPKRAVQIPLGLSESLLTITGTNNAWTQQTVDISAYANSTVRLVFRYQNGNGFNGDIQIDDINIDGNTYSFENQTHSFQTSTSNISVYENVVWSNVAVEQGNNGAWQVDTGGTPSNNTGRSDAADGSYYVYAETTSPANTLGYNIWLRSPEIILGSAPLLLTFSEARNGANIGTLDIHLEVIA